MYIYIYIYTDILQTLWLFNGAMENRWKCPIEFWMTFPYMKHGVCSLLILCWEDVILGKRMFRTTHQIPGILPGILLRKFCTLRTPTSRSHSRALAPTKMRCDRAGWEANGSETAISLEIMANLPSKSSNQCKL